MKDLSLCVVTVLLIALASAQRSALPKKWKNDIDASKPAFQRIHRYLESKGRNEAYNFLANMTDQFGHRIAGSEGNIRSIRWLRDEMDKLQLANIRLEDAFTPNFKRGKEKAAILTPRYHNMTVLRGLSIGTYGRAITANVVIFRTVREMIERRNEVPNKFVLFNYKWRGYGAASSFRRSARKASELGAKAVLMRSTTPYSLYTPHATGASFWYPNAIPHVCITVEDTEQIQRYVDRGENVTVRIQLDHGDVGNTTTQNIIAEITGEKYPNQWVVFGAHSDSWDQGTGALDDGGGIAITWQAMKILQTLGLRPKRSIRLILWNGEEMGLWGARAYYDKYKDEANSTSILMESDMGTFEPKGMNMFQHSGLVTAILEYLMDSIPGNNATSVLTVFGAPPDGVPWIGSGVPLGLLVPEGAVYPNDFYFNYHHSKPEELKRCALFWTSIAFGLANTEEILPRDGVYPSLPPTPSASGYAQSYFFLAMAMVLTALASSKYMFT